jgi:predicted porin
MKRLGIAIVAGGLASFAHAADLPTAKPEAEKPSCFSSLWNYIKSSVRDCPLTFGPFTLYGTLDGGFGYEQWGTRIGQFADKPNYAIQRNSGDTHWLWSPNGLSTSTIGVRLSQKIGDNWEIVGAVEAGFNPYTLRLVNGPQSQADNDPFTAPFQRTAFDSARAGTWDNGQAFVRISNPAYGTLTFGRTTLLSVSALSAYDPVASVAFSQLVARVTQSAGYSLLSFTRAWSVVNCQSALA